MNFKISKMNAVFIYVGDMKLMRQFYEEMLGLGKPIVETDIWVEYELPGTHLALHQATPEEIQEKIRNGNAVKFSLEVDDIEKAYEELNSKGVHFEFPPKKDFGSLLAEFIDPEGNRFRFIEFK